MKSIHFICRGRLHLSPTKFPTFESGFWDLAESEAKQLLGGMLYLHETKADLSYFGGRVESYQIVGKGQEYAGRVVFIVDSLKEGKGVAWKGANHSMAWSSGIFGN